MNDIEDAVAAAMSDILIALDVDVADIDRLREIADSHPGGRAAWILERVNSL